MKMTMKTSLRLFTLTTALAASMLAQRMGPRAGGGTPPDPATMAQHQVERLTTLLNLTTAQASQATTIFSNAATATATLQTNLHTDRTALQAAVKSNSAATIDQLSTAIGTVEGQILAAQSKADAAFYAILTSDQQTKLDSLHGFGRGGFGPGPGGPRPRG
jgi:Spy/CpxP family protein refolding chaperone